MQDAVRIEWTADGCSAVADIGYIGGGIRQYVCCGRAVMPLDTDVARRKHYSGATLAPWPNRLAGGSWTSEGVQYEGDCNDPQGNALHGLVYDALFEVTSRSESAVTLTYVLGEQAIYPFRVRIDLAYVLHSNGLSCTVTATNLADERAPIALGVHPYFPYDADTTLVTSATTFDVQGDGQIPTGAQSPVAGIGITPNADCRIAPLSLDHCLSGHDRDGTGRAHTVLKYANGAVTDIWQDDELGYTQLFTKPDFPWADGVAGAIGIEPQSAPANAFNSGTGLRWLAPGDVWSVRWGIDVRNG